MTASHTPVIGRAGSNGKYQLSWCQGWPHAPGFLKMNCERKQSSCGPTSSATRSSTSARRENASNTPRRWSLNTFEASSSGDAVAPDEVRLGQHERLGLRRAVGLGAGDGDDVVEHRLAGRGVGEARQPHEAVLVEVVELRRREGAHPHQRSTYCGCRCPPPSEEAARRRTFAIISHPDAGKTTLTEKFLLYGGAVQSAGAVKARGERRRVTSDWMEMEQKRGISITSTVLQFPYRDHVLNLLDTPGHRDFSEDTYRVLAAADAAIMVLDAAKGIEPQTLKLFEVCRERGLPLLTFINKWDRPGPRAARAARPDRAAAVDRAGAGHLAGRHRRRLPRRGRPARRPLRALHPHGPRRHRGAGGGAVARDEAAAARGRRVDARPPTSSSCSTTPTGSTTTASARARCRRCSSGRRSRTSACACSSTRWSTWRRRPSLATTRPGVPRPLDAPFSAFAFKVQANMDPSHRDRIAFVRVCSGRFERGMVVTHGPTGKPFATKYAHSVFGQERDTIEEAWPGDVIGLVNAMDVTRRRRALPRAGRSSSRGCPSSRPSTSRSRG